MNLLGCSFTILTDHRALEWLECLKGKNSQLTRWSLSLQPYSFTVKFHKGILNQNADALFWLIGEDGQPAKGGEESVKDWGLNVFYRTCLQMCMIVNM